MVRKSWLIFEILFLSLVAAGLTSAKSAKEDPAENEPYVANFSYTPPSQRPSGSGGVTLAVLSGIYVSDARTTQGADWRSSPAFARLNNALKEDISKIFAAKGFGVRGPFDSYDFIPYQDKKRIDFYAVPSLELMATSWKDTNVETEDSGSGQKVYHGTGTIEMNGNLTIKLQEIMTRELMWSKTIPITYSFQYDVRLPYFTGAPRPFDMGLVIDDMAKGMEPQYPKTLETFFNLLDPEEMRALKKQAQELRKKKGL